MVLSLEQAEVVVVGASSGLGLATAQAAAERGARVTMVARDAGRLEEARAEVGGAATAVALDATDADAVSRLFAALDRIDHVVSFAGQQTFASVADTDHRLFHQAIDGRVWSARNLCAAAAPKMPPTGSFTFCSGTTADRPRPDRGAGAAATAAVESFGRAMAVELAPIRVNTISPGVIDTPMLQRVVGDDGERLLEPLVSRLPLKRVGAAGEVADAVLFLMGNGYVTGTVLHVDGGFRLM